MLKHTHTYTLFKITSNKVQKVVKVIQRIQVGVELYSQSPDQHHSEPCCIYNDTYRWEQVQNALNQVFAQIYVLSEAFSCHRISNYPNPWCSPFTSPTIFLYTIYHHLTHSSVSNSPPCLQLQWELREGRDFYLLVRCCICHPPKQSFGIIS